MSKKRDDSYFAAGRRRKKKYMMIIIPIIIAVAAAGTAGAVLYQPAPVMAISGVECHRAEQLNYHVHSHLDVFVDGQKQEIPASIGILSSPSCLYWLHTHDTAGLVHIEAPQSKEFTLGQFLDIWNQTRDSSGLLSSVSNKNATAYVNGEPYRGDYRGVQLKSLEEIVLAFGKPPADIPKGYKFTVPA
ncbi:MAG: hypothetical protein AUJ08_03210 [Thaumarchaeota archaeon 13_1_40CM_3_50_5]|nr:MAG: hypothetical protein AUJ08_03210 [Thaumarchaeota archaeon 13_1_40CM_3_50_5]